jgi:hypothetical protein
MKLLSLFLSLLLLAACIRKGAESKYVKFKGYQLIGDGNDNDSTFFELTYENKSDQPLKEPYIRMVIKDTSAKMFKPILFSDSKNFEDVGAKQYFNIYFYSKGYQFSAETGKMKFYLEWTNSKGKRSFRRAVR